MGWQVDDPYDGLITKPKQDSGKFVVRTSEGTVFTDSLPKGASVGSFQGKAGSIRRNSKGGTRRLPNGRRKYQNNPFPAIPGLSIQPEMEVISYKA